MSTYFEARNKDRIVQINDTDHVFAKNTKCGDCDLPGDLAEDAYLDYYQGRIKVGFTDYCIRGFFGVDDVFTSNATDRALTMAIYQIPIDKDQTVFIHGVKGKKFVLAMNVSPEIRAEPGSSEITYGAQSYATIGIGYYTYGATINESPTTVSQEGSPFPYSYSNFPKGVYFSVYDKTPFRSTLKDHGTGLAVWNAKGEPVFASENPPLKIIDVYHERNVVPDASEIFTTDYVLGGSNILRSAYHLPCKKFTFDKPIMISPVVNCFCGSTGGSTGVMEDETRVEYAYIPLYIVGEKTLEIGYGQIMDIRLVLNSSNLDWFYCPTGLSGAEETNRLRDDHRRSTMMLFCPRISEYTHCIIAEADNIIEKSEDS